MKTVSGNSQSLCLDNVCDGTTNVPSSDRSGCGKCGFEGEMRFVTIGLFIFFVQILNNERRKTIVLSVFWIHFSFERV